MNKLAITKFTFLLFILTIMINACTKDPLHIPYYVPDLELAIEECPYPKMETISFNIKKTDVLNVLNGADLNNVTAADFKAGLKLVAYYPGSSLHDIESAEVYIKVKDTNQYNIGTQIAVSEAIGENAKEVSMKIVYANVKDIISDDMTVTLKVYTDEGSNYNVGVKLTSGIIDVTITQ